MNSYPCVSYPESLLSLKQTRPTIKEVFGVSAPISEESSFLTYLGVLIIAFLVTLLLSLIIGSLINLIFLPIINSATSKNAYHMTEFGGYLLFGVIYLACVVFGFRFFLDGDKAARLEYQSELVNYARLSQEIKSPIVILTFKHEKMRNIMSNSGSLLRSLNARKGVSELGFFDYLSANFPSNIAKNFTQNLSVDFDEQRGDNIKLYTPDIIYQDPNLKFRLDIEIDEPYVGLSGNPIHFLNEAGNSKDYFRDQTFLRNNWTLIKFSEEQVVINPGLCLEYIDCIIKSIYSVLLQEPDSKLPIVMKWTEKEARVMAATKYREKYLGIIFSSGKNDDNDLPF